MKRTSKRSLVDFGFACAYFVRTVRQSWSLRTKLLLSFILLSASLTWATLLVVRGIANAQAQRGIERDTQLALRTFKAVEAQRELVLRHRADLLASVAFMRNGDLTTIDADDTPWNANDVSLLVLADDKSRITGMRVSGPTFPVADAQAMLLVSLGRGETSGWWFSGTNVYQVVLPILPGTQYFRLQESQE